MWSVFSNTLLLEIHGGEGGEDSKLFVADLLFAYQKYASNCNLKFETLTEEHGHVIARISGKNCWKYFKNESGKHVVQRVPPTERNDRRQTSVLTVCVMPLPPDNTLETLADKDIEIICQTGKQGAGGQNVNKVASAVRIKHKPTGLSVFINGRDQSQNKTDALKLLTFRVNEQKRIKSENDYNNKRKDKMMSGSDTLGGRGDKIRVYNFIRGEVIDYRLNKSTRNIKGFMKGDFTDLFSE